MPEVDLVLLDLVADHLRLGFGHADATPAHAPVENRDRELQAYDLLVQQVRIGRPERLPGLRQSETGVYRSRCAPLGFGLGDAGIGVERADLVVDVERRIFQRLVQDEDIIDVDGRNPVVEHGIDVDVFVVTEVGIEFHLLLADGEARVVDRQAVVEHAQLELQQFVLRDAAQPEPLLRNGVQRRGVGVVLDGDGVSGLAQQQFEVIADGLRRDLLHRLDVGALGEFVLLRGDFLVPAQFVVGEQRLGVRERNGLRIVGFRILRGELVQSVERRIEPQGSARQRDVLLDRQAQRILQVVVVQIAHFSRVVVLQQAQRTVETQHLARQVERRQPAGLERPERPVGRKERIFGHHRCDGLVLGRIDGVVERQPDVDRLRLRSPFGPADGLTGRRCRRLRRGRREAEQSGRDG